MLSEIQDLPESARIDAKRYHWKVDDVSVVIGVPGAEEVVTKDCVKASPPRRKW